MTAENVLMCVPRSAACWKKFYDESSGLGEQCFQNIIKRACEMLQEKQGKRNKTKQKLLKMEGATRRDCSSYSYCYFLTANLVKTACFETTRV